MYYKLKKGDKYPTYEEIISNPEYMPKIYGETGGFQPEKGGWYFRGKPLKTYEKGSFSDLLIESFAGSHDFLGGQIWGWYGTDGNTSRGRSKFENMASGTTAAIRILLLLPLTLVLMSCIMPVVSRWNPDVYNKYTVIHTWQKPNTIGHTDAVQRKKDFFECGVKNFREGVLDLNVVYPGETSDQATQRSNRIIACIESKGYISVVAQPEHCTKNGVDLGKCN